MLITQYHLSNNNFNNIIISHKIIHNNNETLLTIKTKQNDLLELHNYVNNNYWQQLICDFMLQNYELDISESIAKTDIITIENEIILNIHIIPKKQKIHKSLYIPLIFWFNRSTTLAFPLVCVSHRLFSNKAPAS